MFEIVLRVCQRELRKKLFALYTSAIASYMIFFSFLMYSTIYQSHSIFIFLLCLLRDKRSLVFIIIG